MSIRRNRRAVFLLLAAFIGGGQTATANDETLERAKSLYASAAYDEALALLERLESVPPPEGRTSIAEYRVFCLLALDRGDEARKNIELILHDNPLYFPSTEQASPRIQRVFRDVRRQLLPRIVVERYAAAKASFERKDSRAAQQFDDVLTLLDDPDLQGTQALSDLREVASAFRDLTKALAASAPQVAEVRPPTEQAVVPPQQPLDVIYTLGDGDVTPPVAQSQKMPTWRASANEAAQEFKGVLRLLIDESGTVVSASMPASTRPAYDQLLLKAAREWKFLPALRQGMPVRYLQLIEIHLKPGAR